MRRAAFLFLLPGLALAAVDGTVVNRTTGKPQSGAAVALVEMGGEGKKPLGEAQTDAQGRFRFEHSPQGPVLLQTTHQGVSYSATVQPGAPAAVELEIFDVSKAPAAAPVAQHVVLLEPSGNQLAVTDSFAFNNEGKTTFHDPAAGAAQTWIPEAAKDTIRVTVVGPNNLPLQRGADRAGAPNTYKVDFPIKPGETRIDFNYSLPYSSPGKFSTRLLQKGMQTRLIVPSGVEVKGQGLEELGREPRSQAQIFNVTGGSIEVEVQGAGSLRPAEAAAGEEEGGPGIQQILPRIYDRVYVIMGLGVLILALGFALLYRRT